MHMKNEEIFNKAIDKAVEGGYSPRHINWAESSYIEEKESIIFDHRFARAFWPQVELKKCDYCCVLVGPGGRHYSSCVVFKEPAPLWQHHLQIMVLCEDRIQYLEKFL